MSAILERVGLQNDLATGVTAEKVVTSLSTFLSADANADERDREHYNLLRFQNSPESWKISLEILESPDIYPIEVCTFAAQTLRLKTENNSDNIGMDLLTVIRDSLIALLRVYAEKRVIVNHISLTLTNIAILMPEWQNPVGHLLDTYGENADMITVLLEFLTVMSEELTYTSRIHNNPQNFFARSHKILTVNAQLINDFLVTSLRSKECNSAILECLATCIETGDIPVSIIIKGPLINSLLKFLSDSDLLDQASECFARLFARSYSGGDHTADNISTLHSLLWTIRTIMLSSPNSHSTIYLCKIYVSAGESWVVFLVENYHEYADIIETILQLTSSKDLNVVKLTISFWYCLIRELCISETKLDSNKASHYYPVIRMLIQIMENNVRFPFNYDSFSEEEHDDFLNFRHEICYNLEDCVDFIDGEEALSIPLRTLQENLSTVESSLDYSDSSICADPKWSKIEAAMYCIRAISRKIRFKSSPVILNLMLLVQNTPNQPTIRRSLILMLACYAEWIASHPDFIPYTLRFIEEGFHSRECSSASAFSLKCICEVRLPYIGSYVDQLHLLYTNNIQYLKASAVKDLTRAMAHVISSLDSAKVVPYFKLFVSPLIESIDTIIKSIPTKPSEEHAQGFKCIESNLRNISIFFKYVNSEEICQIILEYWPTIARAIELFATKESIAESAVTALSNILRYQPNASDLLVSDIIKCIHTQFILRRYSCWLYATKWVINRFGDDRNTIHAHNVSEMLQKLSCLFLESFPQRQDDLEAIHYEIEDFFIMSGEALKRMPISYTSSLYFNSVLVCALQCLFVSETNALAVVLIFFKTLFKPNFDSGDSIQPDQNLTLDANNYREATISILNQPSIPSLKPDETVECRFYEGFVYTLLKNLGSIYQRDKETTYLIASLITVLSCLLSSQVVYSAVEESVCAIIPTQTSESFKQEFLSDFKSAIETGDSTSLELILRDFTLTFRQR